MTEAKDYLDFLEQHRLMDDSQKYPAAVGYARACEREIATLREERDRLRADVQAAIDEYGHAGYCKRAWDKTSTPYVGAQCDCIIGDLQRALEGRE